MSDNPPVDFETARLTRDFRKSGQAVFEAEQEMFKILWPHFALATHPTSFKAFRFAEINSHEVRMDFDRALHIAAHCNHMFQYFAHRLPPRPASMPDDLCETITGDWHPDYPEDERTRLPDEQSRYEYVAAAYGLYQMTDWPKLHRMLWHAVEMMTGEVDAGDPYDDERVAMKLMEFCDRLLPRR